MIARGKRNCVDRPRLLETRKAAPAGVGSSRGSSFGQDARTGGRDAHPTRDIMQFHRWEHGLFVVGKMAALYIEALAREIRGADALITGGKLRFSRQLLELVED